MHNINNYIFDLDGTLINSSKEVLLCFEKAFEKAGVEIDKSRLTPNVIGPPLKEIILSIKSDITDDKMAVVMQNFRQIYDYDENDISELYDGIMDLLRDLKSSGKKLFIATFKPSKPTFRIVEQFGLDMFEDVYTIDKFGKHITKSEMISDIIEKYNLDKIETVMIGDAASDVKAAGEAGVTGIGVLWGYGEDKAPLKEHSDFIVENTKELREWAKLSYQTI